MLPVTEFGSPPEGYRHVAHEYGWAGQAEGTCQPSNSDGAVCPADPSHRLIWRERSSSGRGLRTLTTNRSVMTRPREGVPSTKGPATIPNSLDAWRALCSRTGRASPVRKSPRRRGESRGPDPIIGPPPAPSRYHRYRPGYRPTTEGTTTEPSRRHPRGRRGHSDGPGKAPLDSPCV